MEFESNPVGVFSAIHFVYMVVAFALIIVVTIFVKKKVTTDKSQDIFLRLLSVIILIVMLIYRVYIAVNYILVDQNPLYNWWIILPTGLCGVTCMGLPIATLIKPRNNITYHFFVYLVIYGTILTLIYPIAYYKDYSFFHPYGFFGMMYHSLALMLSILLISTKSFKPELKKWWVMPVGYALIIVFGFIELYLMNLPEAMNISTPMIPAAPILTSWYGIGIASVIATIIFILIYNKVTGKKNVNKAK